MIDHKPLDRREWAWAMLIAALLAAGFLGGAVSGRVLSPAGLLYSYAPWNAIAPPADLGPGNGLLSDSVLQFEPWLAYAARRLHAGELPLWNLDNMLGAPFIGNMQSAIFDPFNWPYLLWPDPAMLAVRAWLRLLIVGLGTYGLARAVLRVGPVPAALAGISFAFGAFLTVWLLYPLTGAVAWLPWLWWATAAWMNRPRPRAFAALAAGAALPLLAGQPEMALHLALATGAWALFCAVRAGGGRTGVLRLAGWAGAYVLGVMLASVQVLPFLEYLGQSATWQARAGAAPDLWLPPYLAWTLVSPLLFGTPIHSDWWNTWTNYNEAANYAGLLPLLLVPLAFGLRERRAVAAFLLAGASLAAGVAYHLPGFFDVWTALPLLHTAANQRLIVFVQFALALLGALGLEALLTQTKEHRRQFLTLAGWAILLLTVGVGVPLLVPGWFGLPAEGPAQATWAAGLWRVGVGLGAGVGGLLAVGAGLRSRAGRWLAAGVPLLALADLWSVHRGYNPTLPPAAHFPPTAVTTALQQAGPGRLVATGWTLPPNTGLAYGLTDLRGYDALMPASYFDLLRALDPSLPARAGGGFRPLSGVAAPVLDLLGGRYLLLPPGDDPNEQVDVRQDGAHDEVVGEITGPYRIGQTFVAGADNLTAVQVFGATYGHAATGRLRFHLRTDPAAPTDLATADLDAATLGDDAVWTFRFPPVRQARGRTFYFYLEAPDVPEDRAVTVYYTKGNPYRAGSRMQDGRPAGGDLVFRTLAALNPDAPPFAPLPVGEGNTVAVYGNQAAQPRAWIVNGVEVLADPAARLRRLADPAFDRAHTAVLAAPLPAEQTLPPAPAVAAAAAVTITRTLPEAVDLTATSAAPGLLILADQAFPGWTATLDSAPVPILTVDHALRGVYLPAGTHAVAFRYAPASFTVGAFLSGGALLLIGILLFDPRRHAKGAKSRVNEN